ncbi:hypothetical protein [Haloechinothrix salitolerans]|uniref:LVIVD repeat-containing protein n=1 Tax=Haloechinothrix salitolerans TaxID=926830 RepID=A0ABW2BZ52_9PSEU
MAKPHTKRPFAVTLVAVLASTYLLASTAHADTEARFVKHTEAYGDVVVSTSTAKGNGELSDKAFTVTNHVVSEYAEQDTDGKPQKYLLVWAGDENIADTAVDDVEKFPESLRDPVNKVRNASVGPDFLAVIDVTKGSPSYGRLVNTATVGPLVENEPHHMQYTWHRGDAVYAGGLFSSVTYSFDVSALPEIKLNGVSVPTDTMGGSVPDAYWVLSDGTAYATYMGGPVVPGPYRYSDGSVRTGNGFAGGPGMVVRFDRNAKVLSESPAATPAGEDPKRCQSMVPVGKPSCANPHGIQLREDLDTMVTADYVEPRSLILDPVPPPSPYLFRRTVRIWDISDRDHPKVRSVSYLPNDPDEDVADPRYEDSSAVMEVAVTHQPDHKGAFVQTMKGGGIFYTPDITAPKPQWRKVWDDGAAFKAFNPDSGDNGADANGGWIWVSENDRFLYHTIMGRHKGTLSPDDPGAPGGVIALDISKLVNGEDPECDLHAKPKANDCPTLAGAAGINADEPGKGPHFGNADNFKLGPDGKYHETDQPTMLSMTDYFVARSGHGGDHKLWVSTVSEDGQISVDEEFNDLFVPERGWDFNRDAWPHGPFGNAKPHHSLFVVADKDVR